MSSDTSNGAVRVYATAVDPMGNVAVAGQFFGTIDLGTGVLASPAMAFSYFVAKFDCDGFPLWSKGFDASSFVVDPGDLAMDGDGSVFLQGKPTGPLDLGLGPLVTPQFGFILAKFDGVGNTVWNTVFPGIRGGIAVDSGDNVFMAGNGIDATSVGGSALSGISLVKLDTSGQHVWSKGSLGQGGPVHLALDPAGNIALCGKCQGVVNFGGAPLSGMGMFLAKLDASGAHVFSKLFVGSPAPVNCTSVAAGAAGEVAFGGEAGPQGSVDWGDGPVSLNGMRPHVVGKFSAMGAKIFVQMTGNKLANNDRYPQVAVDAAGDVFVTGGFSAAPIDFGGGPVMPSNLQPSNNDVYVAKLGPGGALGWLMTYGDTEDQWSSAMALDPLGAPVIVGTYGGMIDFGSGLLPDPMNTAVDPAGFVAKLAP